MDRHANGASTPCVEWATYVDGTDVVDDRIVWQLEVEEFADGGHGFRDAPPFDVFDVAGLVRGRQTQQ